MAGLGPGHPRRPRGADMLGAYVYIMTNRPSGTLYTGVTNDVVRRVWEHREGIHEGFTKRYGLKRLVYYEELASIVEAISREKAMKHRPRAWKVRLILQTNPEWRDLWEDIGHAP